ADEPVVGARLLPREINKESQQWNHADNWNVVRRRSNIPKLSPIHKISPRLTWGRAPSPVRSSAARRQRRHPANCREGILPSELRYFLGSFTSDASITGAGPEMPPSFRTRQKCTIISTDATIGIPIQCQIYDRSSALASTIEPPNNPKRTSLYGVMPSCFPNGPSLPSP